MRALQAANADIVVVCSYPLDSVGMVQAVNELGYKPKMFGGAMVGLQATVFKNKLGPALNGIINYETWVPSTSDRPATNEFLKNYQARAGAEGVDPLGYYLGGWGYAYLEMLGDAINGTKSIDDDKIADYLRKNTRQDHHGRHQLRQGAASGPSPACCRCSITTSRRAPASIAGRA